MTGKYRCIVIAGKIGTGTSTLGKELAEKLGWEFSAPASQFFREKLKDRGIDSYGEVPDSLDVEIDNLVKKKIENAQHQIFEGRLVGFLAKDLPDVLKILLTASLPVRIERVLKRGDDKEKTLLKRDRGEEDKYLRIYQADPLNPAYFDLVINNDNLSVADEVKLVSDIINSDGLNS